MFHAPFSPHLPVFLTHIFAQSRFTHDFKISPTVLVISLLPVHFVR